ncbi:NAD(P)/FAD-dependent oxidoreductase [Novosphingobium terrae]|uniref:NAD(P)/FAD-dependent oxidoreductase n=1 Tax=Novosphingobium terrae TaxID=2726189 RepID=UPI0019803708|nr:FAD-dependent oxidoreductase [Novosphingobium terrae]
MTKQTILVAGSGFAGVWAVLAAARAIALAGREEHIDLIMVAPQPRLAIRPRFYEAVLDNMEPDVSELLKVVGARFIDGIVETIGTETREAAILRGDGTQQTIRWDRFVLATGSRVAIPPIPGLAEHAFTVDQLDQARQLDAHIKALPDLTDTPARQTVVVAGGGFTGLEAATELHERLRVMFPSHKPHVVIVDPAQQIGAEFGAEAGQTVRDALAEIGIEQRPGVRLSAVDAGGAQLSDGSRIEAATVVWAAGVRAHPLAAQIPGEHDAAGRVIGDSFLHAPAAPGVFVTGDTVKAATDDAGNFNLMTCQHGLSLGRVAGYNAAAELVGLPLHPYSQPKYVTCLDLGAWGAMYTEGWDRQVRLTRAEGKKLKQEINGVWIYPPAADRDAAFAVAHPDFVIVP